MSVTISQKLKPNVGLQMDCTNQVDTEASETMIWPKVNERTLTCPWYLAWSTVHP